VTSDLDRLAVYGTLAPGGPNAGVLAHVPGEWTRGTVRGTRHEDGWRGFPGLVLDAAGEVPVDVLTSSALAGEWERLDTFEGPGYRRVVTDVVLEDGGGVRAHVYVLAGPPGLPGAGPSTP
jgi:gamma-glutamylcyclotransferase (GGCT)/AIG2-like uncharacterized protein YtfP